MRKITYKNPSTVYLDDISRTLYSLKVTDIDKSRLLCVGSSKNLKWIIEGTKKNIPNTNCYYADAFITHRETQML